jgi:hypothetical protein
MEIWTALIAFVIGYVIGRFQPHFKNLFSAIEKDIKPKP